MVRNRKSKDKPKSLREQFIIAMMAMNQYLAEKESTDKKLKKQKKSGGS